MVALRTEWLAGRCSAILLALCVLVPRPGIAQSLDRATEFEDLGLTRHLDVSARGIALAGVVPVADDASALIYNPAGLCRIKKRTALLGLSHDAQEIITDHGSGTTGLSSSRNGLLFAGGVLPLPMYRGNLVPAVAVHRMFVSDLALAYHAANAVDGRTDDFRIDQAGSTYALALGFGVDLASVLTAGLGMSVFEGGYHALRQTHTRTVAGSVVDRYVIDDIDADLDGVVARLGVSFYPHRHIHLGLNVSTPALVNASAQTASEITEVVENSTGSTTTSSATLETSYLVPYRLEGGLEVPWRGWLVAVQVGTCDWSNAAIDKKELRLENTEGVLGRTVDYRAGVEWTAPAWPLRLRAGVARLPFSPRYLQADRVDNDRMEPVIDESTPIRYSFGAGVAFGRTILVDAAYSRTHGDRRTASLSEERTTSQIVIEGSYWF